MARFAAAFVGGRLVAVFPALATLFFGLAPFFERAFDDATGAPGSATLALVSASTVVWLVLLVMGSRFCAFVRMTIHHSTASKTQVNTDRF